MKRTEAEKKKLKKAFRNMTLAQKADYLFTYYKLPAFTAVVVLAVIISSVIHAVTKKEPVLYLAFVNTSVGEELDEKMTGGYISHEEYDPKKQEVLVYRDLYIDDDASVENHQYAYASRLKILGAISSKQMDVALMNRDAYQQMSESGLLMPLDEIKKDYPQQYSLPEPYITANTVIIDDNAIEYDLNEADTYEAVTEEVNNAVNVTSFPVFRNADMSGDVYMGIIANTTHPRGSANYIVYLLGLE